MNNTERLYWEIEKKSYQEVIKQFSKGDARMSTSLDEFLCGIEKKIKEINDKLSGT